MQFFFIIILITNISLFANDTFEIDNETEIFDDFEKEFDTNSKESQDSLYSYNVTMTQYNDLFYTKVFFPLSDSYINLVPENGRLCISNFFENLGFPIRFMNNLAQLKFRNTIEESKRFVINSTIGVAGLFDIADSKFKLKKHNEDFGQTLGFYGVGSGFHIVLPFLGPSNIRDAFSILVDSKIDPTIHYFNTRETFTTKSFFYVNEASFKMKEYKSLKKDAIALYPYLKNIYEQHRESEIQK